MPPHAPAVAGAPSGDDGNATGTVENLTRQRGVARCRREHRRCAERHRRVLVAEQIEAHCDEPELAKERRGHGEVADVARLAAAAHPDAAVRVALDPPDARTVVQGLACSFKGLDDPGAHAVDNPDHNLIEVAGVAQY
jgi:hypothetical protein